MSKVTLGADPEVFLKGTRFIPSLGLIGGTKHEPKDYGDGILLQEDNVTVEYNIPPCDTFKDWNYFHGLALRKITNLVKKHDLSVVIQGSAYFEEADLAPESLRIAGCEPDISAYTLETKFPPELDKNWRGAGGHIHIAMPTEKELIVNTIKAMDLMVGIPLAKADPDPIRRTMYGQAGSFRPKSYGVEYRTPSNKWISGIKWRRYVWKATQKAMQIAEGNMGMIIAHESFIRAAIDEGDQQAAAFVLDIFKDHFAGLTND